MNKNQNSYVLEYMDNVSYPEPNEQKYFQPSNSNYLNEPTDPSNSNYLNDPSDPSEPSEQISYDGYSLVKILGQGYFGKVWKAIREDGKIIALKIIKINPDDPKKLNVLKKEVEILTKISLPKCQPFLVCFNGYKYLRDRHEFIIEMDLIKGKNLREYVNTITDNKIKYKHLLLIMKDLIKALKYLHDNGIIHNDVKPDNIMIDDNLTPILVDFGVSCSPNSICSVDGVESTCCKNIYGPNLCISPETLNNKAYFFQSDIWSLGITFYIVSTGGEYPFSFDNIKSLYDNIKTTDPFKLKTSNNILNNIVNKCLIKNPVTRIKLTEISVILG